MDSSRRHFMQSSTALAAATMLPQIVFGETQREVVANRQGLPIVQGATEETTAAFVALVPATSAVFIEIKDLNQNIIPHQIVDFWPLPQSLFATLEFKVEGLTLNTEYTLNVLGEDGQTLDSRIFYALDTRRTDLRMALVSCMDDSHTSKVDVMWQSLSREQCDIVIFLGDTCYADHGLKLDPEVGLARRYAETRSSLSWFRQQRLVPSFATWDDHDYGANNGDRTFKHASFTRMLFRKFWGSTRSLSYRSGQGVGSVFEGFGQRFYLLDNRSFRDKAGGKKTSSYLGAEQTEWLVAALDQSSTPSWVMTGGQFLGGYFGLESFRSGYPTDFKNFMTAMSKVQAPVCFASGDVHFSEVIRLEPQLLGYSTYEVTSSAMHSITMPGHQYRNRNSRRLVSEWRHNYLVINVSTQHNWHIETQCMLQGNRKSFNSSFEIFKD